MLASQDHSKLHLLQLVGSSSFSTSFTKLLVIFLPWTQFCFSIVFFLCKLLNKVASFILPTQRFYRLFHIVVHSFSCTTQVLLVPLLIVRDIIYNARRHPVATGWISSIHVIISNDHSTVPPLLSSMISVQLKLSFQSRLAWGTHAYRAVQATQSACWSPWTIIFHRGGSWGVTASHAHKRQRSRKHPQEKEALLGKHAYLSMLFM